MTLKTDFIRIGALIKDAEALPKDLETVSRLDREVHVDNYSHTISAATRIIKDNENLDKKYNADLLDIGQLGYNLGLDLLLDTLYKVENDLLLIDPSLGSPRIHERSSSNTGEWSLIHTDICKVSKEKFDHGHYADSVESAFKELNAIIKGFYKNKTGKELDGVALMREVFSPKSPSIVLGDLATESGRDVQEGYGHIFAGSMQGIRNPSAHANLEISSGKAMHLLFLASHLMFMIDDKLK